MKKIKLYISDDYFIPDYGLSPLWKNAKRYIWEEVEKILCLNHEIISRLKDWQNKTIEAKTPFTSKEERIKCEIKGLSLLLELRKELPDYQIEYQSIFGFYIVLNEEQIDDNY